MKQVLKISREMWESLTLQQQQEQHNRFVVSVAPSYAPTHDLDMPIELAMVARHA